MFGRAIEGPARRLGNFSRVGERAPEKRTATPRDLNRLTWPPSRPDVMAVAFFGIALYCVLAERWPAVAVVALLASLFAGLSPRMKGPFGFNTPNASLGGEFEDPFAAVTPAAPEERWELGPGPRRELPPRTGSGEG